MRLGLPISAMVVGFNEANFLPQCFDSISFCDEILYTDLGSTDNSVDIAQKHAQQIFKRRPVPSCEMIQTEVVHYTKNDWVLFIDPDEKVDPVLAQQLMDEFDSITSNPAIGGVAVPWQFYFKRKKLNGTVWGGMNSKFLLVNKNRFIFDPVVHYGRKLKDGFTAYVITPNVSKTNVLHHYWMNSFKIFLRKHNRYLKNEGQDRYNLGVRTEWSKVITSPLREFYRSFYIKKGYKDGILGVALSAFWAWYQSSAILSLFKVQRRLSK